MLYREHLVITPFFRTETPPLGTACLKAYLKQFDIEVGLTDYRLRKNIVDAISNNVNNQFNYAGELPDLPLIQMIIFNFLNNKPILDYMDEAIKDFIATRQVSYFQLKADLEDMHYIFTQDLERLTQYSLVGFTTFATNMLTTVMCACLLKQTRPDITIVMGGPQVTESHLTSELMLRLGVADVVALSDGEETFRQIIMADRAGNSLAVQGTITFDQSSSQILKTTSPILNIQTLPCPDFTGIEVEKYASSPQTLPLYSSRGCPFKCEFCNEWKMWEKYRRLKVEKVIDWMKQLNHSYGATTFHMADSLLNSSKVWIETFADALLEGGLEFKWFGYFRANMNLPLAKKLKQAGLCKAFIGAEAFTEETLFNMRKQTTPDDNVKAAEAFCTAGVVLEMGNIIGFPGETEKEFEIRRQFYYALHDKHPGMFMANSESFRLVPGSGTYGFTEKFGIETIPWDQKYIDAIPAVSEVVSKIPMAIQSQPDAPTINHWLTLMRSNFEMDGRSQFQYSKLASGQT